MAQKEQTNRRQRRKRRSPGAVSRWVQHLMNARMSAKIRRNRGTFMGMDY
jgi:hypothetical protein